MIPLQAFQRNHIGKAIAQDMDNLLGLIEIIIAKPDQQIAWGGVGSDTGRLAGGEAIATAGAAPLRIVNSKSLLLRHNSSISVWFKMDRSSRT